MIKRKEKLSTKQFDQVNMILEGTKIVGDVITNSPFKINGEVVGNIISQSKIEIGKTGTVSGNINCSEADIEGVIEGTIEVNGLLILRESSKVMGDILTNKLHIEEGAVFIGECKMAGNVSQQKPAAKLTQSEKEIQD